MDINGYIDEIHMQSTKTAGVTNEDKAFDISRHTRAKAFDNYLLDIFAQQALVGILTNPGTPKESFGTVAEISYDYAQAMLVERKKVMASLHCSPPVTPNLPVDDDITFDESTGLFGVFKTKDSSIAQEM